MLTQQDRLALDGAFKKVMRAQSTIRHLADEGTQKAMTHVKQGAWDGYFARLKKARLQADVAQDELEALYRTLMPNQSID